VDPISLHELALELNMSIAEITHGRGAPMSAHELTVLWPAFFDDKHREAERQDEIARHKRGRA
jgi:hypothetical protein